MKCPNCSTDLKPQTRFCPSCGTNVEMMTTGVMIPDSDPKIAALERALGNKYKILRKVGSGGFADVYLGEHTQLGRNVAIKILRGSDDEEMIERFRREARAAAKLSHPNIIDIYDVGDHESTYYFVMKYIPGDTLAQKMKREKKIAPGTAIDITKQIVDALAYAHDRGVVHRDIKPANVLIDEFGKPVLMDFGIARMAFVGQLTRTGTLMGTPHYLPPEQPLGKTVDGRSDIYSLGIMFYEMLAGRVPFHDDAAIALIYKHINEQAPRLTSLAPEIAPELADVVHKMIEKLPENRYQSAHDLFDALEWLSTIYPTRATPARRSTPGGAKDTERLILLAEEHQQQNKYTQALELYGTILQRRPDHKEALEKRDELVSLCISGIKADVNRLDFVNAWRAIADLQRFAPNDPRLTDLVSQLEGEEQRSNKEKDFLSHFQAAQTALKHDNAGGAVEHLTKALTINPSSEEARTLLRDARAAYETNRRKAEFENAFSEAEYHFKQESYDEALTAVQRALKLERNAEALALEEKIQAALKERAYRDSEEQQIQKEVDRACEQLSFADAEKLLQGVKDESPQLVKTLLPKVERNHELYRKFEKAQELYDQNKQEESERALRDFLNHSLPYEFQAFYGLRKQAEEMLKMILSRADEIEIDQLLKKADTMMRMGQLNQARQICLTVLEKSPTHPTAKAKLEEIDRMLGRNEMDTGELLKQMTSSDAPGTEPGMKVPETRQFAEAGAVEMAPPPAPPSNPVAATPVYTPPVSRPVAAPSKRRVAQSEGIFGLSPFMAYGLGAAVGVAILALLLFVFWSPSEEKDVPKKDVNIPQPIDIKQTPAPPEPVATVPVSVSIDVRPWAELQITGKTLQQPIRSTTPVRVSLPAGEYSVICTNPDFASFTQVIQVSEANRNFRFQFQQLDANRIVETLLR